MRVVTDIDLRNPRRLAAVTTYFDKRMPTELSIPSEGREIWIKNQGSRDDFVPCKYWVDHNAKSLGYEEHPSGTYGDDGGGNELSFTRLGLTDIFRARPRVPLLGIHGASSRARAPALRCVQRSC